MTAESSTFPSLRGRVPVDGLARRVTGKGEQHAAPLRTDESETPLLVWKFFGRRCDDLTGRKRGLLTVVGCAAVETGYRPGEKPRRPNRDGTLWVVRCVCGVYSQRRTKTMKEPGPDACSRCKGKGLLGPRVVPA